MTTDHVNIIDTVPAYSLVAGDQILIESDLVVIRSVDDDRPDPDEIFVTFENLSDPVGDTSAELFADDRFEIWAI